jgi:hypothetical protein
MFNTTTPANTRPLPWSRMKRKLAPGATGDAQEWLYSVSSPDGRDSPTALIKTMAWPQGCDQCMVLIDPSAPIEGTRSIRVQRGRTPSTLHICGPCVEQLCRAGAIPAPERDR